MGTALKGAAELRLSIAIASTSWWWRWLEAGDLRHKVEGNIRSCVYVICHVWLSQATWALRYRENTAVVYVICHVWLRQTTWALRYRENTTVVYVICHVWLPQTTWALRYRENTAVVYVICHVWLPQTTWALRYRENTTVVYVICHVWLPQTTWTHDSTVKIQRLCLQIQHVRSRTGCHVQLAAAVSRTSGSATVTQTVETDLMKVFSSVTVSWVLNRLYRRWNIIVVWNDVFLTAHVQAGRLLGDLEGWHSCRGKGYGWKRGRERGVGRGHCMYRIGDRRPLNLE